MQKYLESEEQYEQEKTLLNPGNVLRYAQIVPK